MLKIIIESSAGYIEAVTDCPMPLAMKVMRGSGRTTSIVNNSQEGQRVEHDEYLISQDIRKRSHEWIDTTEARRILNAYRASIVPSGKENTK